MGALLLPDVGTGYGDGQEYGHKVCSDVASDGMDQGSSFGVWQVFVCVPSMYVFLVFLCQCSEANKEDPNTTRNGRMFPKLMGHPS